MKQNIQQSRESNETFREEITQGLLSHPKKMSSKYFYDANGDRLFQEIMESPEYYPTRSETEIFSLQADALVEELFEGVEDEAAIVELGAGDAKKTIHLLKKLTEKKLDFTYLPIDISENIIYHLENSLPGVVPGLRMHGYAGEYFEALEQIGQFSGKRKILLFLGSTIGNMSLEEAADFCKVLRSYLLPGDRLLMGMDLKKNPNTILAAYNDKAGITKRFNLNLLTRINRELHADFNIAGFEHFPTYNPQSGECKSYLISTHQQTVHIGDITIDFEKDEAIDMELSQKFTPKQIVELAVRSGFKLKHNFYDEKKWFVDSLWEAR